MKREINTCFALLILGVIVSCDISYLDKEIDDISWEGSIKIPIGFIDYSLSEIFNDLGNSALNPTSTEEFSFSYNESFSGESDASFNVDIVDTTIESSISSPITSDDLANIGANFPYTITPTIAGNPNPLIGTQSITNQKIHDLELSQEITRAGFNEGSLVITFISTADADLNITINIPSFIKKSDQNSYSERLNISGRTTKTITINLNEYNADFTNDGTYRGNTYNKVAINLEASFTYVAGNEVDENDAIVYEAKLTNAEYDVIYGDFKQTSFNFSSNTLDLEGFFDNFSEGDVSFENVAMAINVTNDYGFPISMDLSSIRAINANSSLNLNYIGNSSLSNTIIIDGVENFGDEDRVTNTILDDTNSNITSLLESKPTSLEFNISGVVNPIDNGNPNENFYASNNNGFNAEVIIGFNKISLDKQLDFDGAENLENFSYINLIVNVENKIPLTGELLIEFKDNNDQVVHSETIDAFLAANVDQSGQSDGVGILSDFQIELNQIEISQITNATKINIRATLQLPTGRDSVIIKGSDELNVSVAIEANASIKPNN